MGGGTIWKETDVLIVGGGASGVIAAVAAARTGAKTLLIEKNSFLGGTATAGMVPQFFAFHHAERQTVAGIPHELLERIKAAGGSNGFDRYIMAEVTDTPVLLARFPFDPEILKVVLDEFLTEANVDLLLCARSAEVTVREKKVTAVLVEGLRKGGLSRQSAQLMRPLIAWSQRRLASSSSVPLILAQGSDSR